MLRPSSQPLVETLSDVTVILTVDTQASVPDEFTLERPRKGSTRPLTRPFKTTSGQNLGVLLHSYLYYKVREPWTPTSAPSNRRARGRNPSSLRS